MKQKVSHYHSHHRMKFMLYNEPALQLVIGVAKRWRWRWFKALLGVFISFKISSKDVLHNISSFIQYGIEYSNKTNDFKVRNPMVIRVDK